MKAIILISSIFYILGLKLSYKFDLTKKCETTEKVITNTVPDKKPEKELDLSGELKAKTDSVKINGNSEKNTDNSIHY